MGEKIQIGKIRQALAYNKKLTRKNERSESDWGIYDSPLEDFRKTFGISLPENYEENLKEGRLKKYIEETLLSEKREKPNLTAVEFGGPGSKLFSGFTPNFFRQTVGVCLKDIRNENQKKDDEKNNHSVIVGDILDISDTQNNKVLNEVKEKLGVKRTDLIICRMSGPIHTINRNSAIMDRIIRNWYSLLNENGLMFIQFGWKLQGLINPTVKTIEILIIKWVTIIKEKFPEIDIQIEDSGVLRLHKKVGAPEELPRAKELFS